MSKANQKSLDLLVSKLNLWPRSIQSDLAFLGDWHMRGTQHEVIEINGINYSEWSSERKRIGKQYAKEGQPCPQKLSEYLKLEGERFLSARDIAERYGVSIVTPWRWTKSGKFPAPVKLGGNCTRWRLSEVVDWEEGAKRYEKN